MNNFVNKKQIMYETISMEYFSSTTYYVRLIYKLKLLYVVKQTNSIKN